MRLFKQLQYRLARLFARGIAQYLSVLIAFLLFTAIGMAAYFGGLFSDQALTAEGIEDRMDGGFWDTLWWSVKHVLDPGAFAEDYGAPWPVLLMSLFLSIAGLALLGTFIGLISTSLQRRFAAWTTGQGPVIERGHTLILGWNQNVFGILRYFARFHDNRGIVVLAPLEVAAMQAALDARAELRALDVILCSGSTSKESELQRVSYERAERIISLAHVQGPSHPDAGTIKTLLLLKQLEEIAPTNQSMVAEVTERQNASIAEIAGGRRIPIVSSGEVVSRVLVQCARYPGISTVLHTLLSPEEAQIVAHEYTQAAGQEFGALARSCRGAVPLGVTWQVETSYGRRTACALNLEAEYDLAEDEQLVLLAATDRPVFEEPAVTGEGLPVPQNIHSEAIGRFLILGWNRNLDEILQELKSHSVHDMHVTVLADLSENQLTAQVAGAIGQGGGLDFNYVRGNKLDQQTLQALHPWSFDRILMLADHANGTADADSSTLMTALLLQDIELQSSQTLPHVVIELEDPDNAPLLERAFDADIVITSELISWYLAQASNEPVLAAIYGELFRAGGMELALRSCGAYGVDQRPMRWDELVVVVQSANEILLGIRTAEGFDLVPEAKEWTLNSDDELVVVAQQIYY